MSARGTIHPQVRHEENPVTMPGEAEEDAFEADQQPKRARRWPWLLGAAVLLGGVVAAVLLIDGTGGETTDAAAVQLSFEPVVQTDLIQMDSFDGDN